MTAERHFERDVRELLVDLYLEPAPDYRHNLAPRFAATPQRSAWTIPERWLPMSVTTLARQTLRPIPWRTLGLIAALALLLLVAIVAYLVGTRPSVPLPYGPAKNGLVAFEEAGDIVVVDPATGTRTVAIGGPTLDTNPVFSRDGTRLAFRRVIDRDAEIFVADATGRDPRVLATSSIGDFETIEWSPDGSSILTMKLLADRQVWIAIVPVDGSAPRVLDLGMPAQDAVWLPPNGAEIMFRTPNPAGEEFGYSLMAVGGDGSGLREVVPVGRYEWDSLFWSASPDGTLIAYQQRDPANEIQKIYIVPVAGGTPRAVTSIESVLRSWSPDGAWLSFASDDDAVYAVPVDGSAPAQQLSVGIPTNALLWTPDGAHILVAEESGTMKLFDPRGGPPEVLDWRAETALDWQRLAPPTR